MKEDERERELKNELSECKRQLHQLDDKILISRVAAILSQHVVDTLNSKKPDTKLVAERIVRLLREFI